MYVYTSFRIIYICNMEIDKLLSFKNLFEPMDRISNLC